MKFKKFFLTLLISLIIIPINAYAYSDKLIVGGNNIGIEVKTKGILVIGTYEINGEYVSKDSNIKAGDYINLPRPVTWYHIIPYHIRHYNSILALTNPS